MAAELNCWRVKQPLQPVGRPTTDCSPTEGRAGRGAELCELWTIALGSPAGGGTWGLVLVLNRPMGRPCALSQANCGQPPGCIRHCSKLPLRSFRCWVLFCFFWLLDAQSSQTSHLFFAPHLGAYRVTHVRARAVLVRQERTWERDDAAVRARGQFWPGQRAARPRACHKHNISDYSHISSQILHNRAVSYDPCG